MAICRRIIDSHGGRIFVGTGKESDNEKTGAYRSRTSDRLNGCLAILLITPFGICRVEWTSSLVSSEKLLACLGVLCKGN